MGRRKDEEENKRGRMETVKEERMKEHGKSRGSGMQEGRKERQESWKEEREGVGKKLKEVDLDTPCHNQKKKCKQKQAGNPTSKQSFFNNPKINK